MTRADWEPAWRARFPGWVVGAAGLWVGPPWQTPAPGLKAVVIDPGRSQGSGAHPATRLCLLLLARLKASDFGSVLDVGCGTGVLGIAAALLGFPNVVCVDKDAHALADTKANAALNGVTVETGLLDREKMPLPRADLVIANFGGPKEFLFPLDRPLAVITSGYDTSTPTPSVPGLTKIQQVAEGAYRGHLHR